MTGTLLMDQRFWGDVCYRKGIGPPPVHIDQFYETCVDFVDRALDHTSSYATVAAALQVGAAGDDGVATNVRHFEKLLLSGLQPVK